MASEAQRCEPPEGLRDRDEWHWIGVGRYMLHFWSAKRQRWSAASIEEWWLSPSEITDNWPFPGKRRYRLPVPDPVELLALVRAARDVREILVRQDLFRHLDPAFPALDNLTTALAAPSIKGIGDE